MPHQKNFLTPKAGPMHFPDQRSTDSTQAITLTSCQCRSVVGFWSGLPSILADRIGVAAAVRRNASTITFCVVLAAFSQSTRAYSQPPLDSPHVAEPFTRTVVSVTIDGQSASEAIDQIIGQVSTGSPGRPWSWWRDGGVDPDKIVQLNLRGGTAADALTQLTKPIGWEVFPIPGILLVGRPEWIDRVLNTLVSSRGQKAIDVQWDRGTSSQEAVRRIIRATSPKSPADVKNANWLPHDVWPAANFRQVDPWHLLSLSLAEFQLAASPGRSPVALLTAGTEPDATAELPALVRVLDSKPSGPDDFTSTTFPMSYSVGGDAASVRRAVQAVFSASTFRSQRDRAGQTRLRIQTTAAGHRAALATVWAAAPVPANVAAAGDDATFDLKLLNKPAAEALAQFAGAANRKLVIAQNAQLRSRRLVSLDATKQTLQQLSEAIAQQAGLVLIWGDDEVRVGIAEE